MLFGVNAMSHWCTVLSGGGHSGAADGHSVAALGCGGHIAATVGQCLLTGGRHSGAPLWHIGRSVQAPNSVAAASGPH
jgi:hypothetical protein